MPLILKPKHFYGLQTAMNNGGLSLCTHISVADWVSHFPSLFGTTHISEERRRAVIGRQKSGGIVLNPHNTSVFSIKRICAHAQEALYEEDEEINAGYGLPDNFCRLWTDESDGLAPSEGQRLVLVNFDKHNEFVGYVSTSFSLAMPIKPAEPYLLLLNFHHLYVHPERRGSGYGLDLSIASGILAGDVLTASYRAIPSNTCIQAIVHAEYETEGGEAFTMHVRDALASVIASLRMQRRRPSVKLLDTVLEAGHCP